MEKVATKLRIGFSVCFLVATSGCSSGKFESLDGSREIASEFRPTTPKIFQESDLVDFYTDGCSGFPKGLPGQSNLWLHCCYWHDQKYFGGGTVEEKKEADLALATCVDRTGNADIASAMYVGVRVGGSPNYKTTFRWGYGWPFGRGYRPVSGDERRWIDKKLQTFPCLSKLNDFTYDPEILHRACRQ